MILNFNVTVLFSHVFLEFTLTLKKKRRKYNLKELTILINEISENLKKPFSRCFDSTPSNLNHYSVPLYDN